MYKKQPDLGRLFDMYQSHLFFISVSLRDFYHNTFYNIMIQQENLKKRLAKLAAPIF